MKDWLLLFFCIIFPIVLFFGGCYQLHQHIYHKMNCNQFNIDHVEVRTGIDIPAKQKVTCDLNAAGNRRINTIFIEQYVNLEDYVKKNGFILQKDNQYVNEGTKEDHKWTATLNTHTRELVVVIDYLKTL